MKTTRHLPSWEVFVEHLAAIKNEHPRNLLFRGHGDARWPLRTTLERRGLVRYSLDDYYRMIGVRVRPQVESITGRTFDVPPYTQLRRLFKEYDKFSRLLGSEGIPAYSYLIYTRHHGFPSPLLDWTRSAFVAAFFAFAAENRGVRRRSIYIWKKSWLHDRGTNTPELHKLGPYVSTHKRHVLQQCDYTVGITFDTSDNQWRFTPQEEALIRSDVSALHHLWKYTLPSTERLKVLAILDDLNINAYSLFGSEEGLMDTLGLRELDLKTAPDRELPLTQTSEAKKSYAKVRKSKRPRE